MKIVLISQTPEKVSGTFGGPCATFEKQFEILSHRIDMVADDESELYLTFFLSLLVIFFSRFVSN